MNPNTNARTRQLRIIAQDPSVLDTRPDGNGKPLTATVDVPVECLDGGPWGYRVQVIDYDCSTQHWAAPPLPAESAECLADRFADTDAQALVVDPVFRAQNVYAIVARTLARFEHALGRHVRWHGDSHHIKVVPHAFRAANAFYARDTEALLFGYFPTSEGQEKNTVYTCLSHDVVVHETAHALLDALHERYVDPSSPDQAAFHEGFADIVALLSVFALPDVVKVLLLEQWQAERKRLKCQEEVCEWLRQSALLGLAEQMGKEVKHARGAALRRSVKLDKSAAYYTESEKQSTSEQAAPDDYSEFRLPHRRGEILVAAVLNAFVEAWAVRLYEILPVGEPTEMDIKHWAEEGADAADYLLTMAIRALDYMPPLHIVFSDYLKALITADLDLHPDDTRYGFRRRLQHWFGVYGIEPEIGSPLPSTDPKDSIPIAGPVVPASASKDCKPADSPAVPDGTQKKQGPEGGWMPIPDDLKLCYGRTHFEPLTRDPDEVFRFIWENRQALRLNSELDKWSYMKVLSVRPCVRTATDGFVLKETVARFYQVIRLTADELRKRGFDVPAEIKAEEIIALYGGGTLIFDDYGRLKYHIHNLLNNPKRQSLRIAELSRRGALPDENCHADAPLGRKVKGVDFAAMHRQCSVIPRMLIEEW